MLQKTVLIGTTIDIPGVGRIHVLEKSGRRVKLAFDLPKDQLIEVLPTDEQAGRRISAPPSTS